MSTLTGTSTPNEPRAVHAGLNSVEVNETFAVTATAASIFLLAKIPNNVTVVSAKLYANDAAADQLYSLGYRAPDGSLTPSAFIASSSISGVTNYLNDSNLLPVTISATATEGANEVWVVAKNDVAISASANLKCIVTYRKN